jgi:hypothetical protein
MVLLDPVEEGAPPEARQQQTAAMKFNLGLKTLNFPSLTGFAIMDTREDVECRKA